MIFISFKDMSDEYLSSRMDNLKVNHCASLVYTSGTTGLPKVSIIMYSATIILQ